MGRYGLVILSLLMLVCFSAEAGRMSGSIGFGIGTGGFGTASVPEPTLLSPVGETVDLTGKETLTFKWSPFEGRIYKRQGYDFRLYKGYQTYAQNEIHKMRTGPNTYAIILEASLFEDGEVYTWTLRQAYFDNKSDAAYNAFQVIKK